MAIQIIDNFNLSVAKPIDDRFVVGSQSFYTNRNNIPYKYTGLRIWDLNDGVPYVWNGTIWASENSISVSGSGNVNYVPKFIGSGVSNTIGESCIYISGASVGVNTGATVTSGYNLHVNGGIISQGATGFSGVGSLLTSLNATQITSGTIPSLARLTNGTASGWILTSGVSQPIYTNPSTLTVGGASMIQITNDTTTSTPLQYITFVDGYTTAQYSTKVSGASSSEDVTRRQLTYKPSTGNLTSALITTGTFSVGPGSTASPSISFSGVTSTGIYRYSTQGFGISVLGSSKLTMDSNGIRHISSAFTSSGVSPASFTIGSGTASIATKITIAQVAYDRIIYLYSSNHDNTYYLTSGWFQIEINVAAQRIYSAFFGVDSGPKSVHNNHCYILPSGVASTITLRKENVGFTNTTGPTITVTSLKFGL